jgi:hypothetical protein
VGQACVPLSVLLPCIIVPLALLLLVVCVSGLSRRRATGVEEVAWMIDGKEIILSSEVLGRGDNGDVVKAQYRGTTVAIKNLVLDWEVRRGSACDAASQSAAADSTTCLADLAEVNSMLDGDDAAAAANGPGGAAGAMLPPQPSTGRGASIEHAFKRRGSAVKTPRRRASMGCAEMQRGRFFHSEPRLSFAGGALSAGQAAPESPIGLGPPGFLESSAGLAQPGFFRSRTLSSYAGTARRLSIVFGADGGTPPELGPLKQSGSFSLRHGTLAGPPSVIGSARQRGGWSLFHSWIDAQLSRAGLQSEIRALVAIRHPCITTIMGATVIRLEGQKRLCLVMELMELGSLWDLLHNETFILRGKQVRGTGGTADREREQMGVWHAHEHCMARCARGHCGHGDTKRTRIWCIRQCSRFLTAWSRVRTPPGP